MFNDVTFSVQNEEKSRVRVTTGLWAEILIRHPSYLPNDNQSAVRDPERIIILHLFIVFYQCNILIIFLYSNKLHSIDVL